MRIRLFASLVTLVFFAATAGVRAEVGEVTIAQQYGVSFLPLMWMEHNKLIEKHAKALGLGELKTNWAKLAGPAAITDGLLAGTNGCGIRWMEQPASQSLLSDVGSRRREQFEEGSLAEEIQVHSVRMRGVEVLEAGLSVAGPVAVQPCKSALEVLDATTVQGGDPKQAVVEKH